MQSMTRVRNSVSVHFGGLSQLRGTKEKMPEFGHYARDSIPVFTKGYRIRKRYS